MGWGRRSEASGGVAPYVSVTGRWALMGRLFFFKNSNAPKIYQMNEYFKNFDTITFLAT